MKPRMKIDWKNGWPLKTSSFFLSTAIHAAVLYAAAYLLPTLEPKEASMEVHVYEVIDLKKEPIIYWARVPAVLPPVLPESTIGKTSDFKATRRSQAENIVVEQPNPETAKQLVWQPDKRESLPKETPLQNMVVIQNKGVATPLESTPANKQPAEPQKTAIGGVPDLPIAKPQPKTFVLSSPPKLVLASGVVAEAPPEIAAAQVKVPGIDRVAGSSPFPRRPSYVPRSVKVDALLGGEGKSLVAPPELSPAGTQSAVTVAIIGLNPADKISALPEGSRSAAFSRAERIGAPAGGTPGQGPTIPGVAIASNARAAAPLAPFPTAQSSNAAVRSFEVAIPPAASTMSAPLRPSARTLPRGIEARFRDRIVYVLVIPKPNLPEYIADWTMWFAERVSDSMVAPSMRAPVPIRKKLRAGSLAAAVGGEGWVQIAAVIGKDGKISAITAVPGRHPALAEKVAEDLANWEFRPGSRNGQAIEVEVVIEVPFRVI